MNQNGNPTLPILPGLPQMGNPEIVRLLEGVMANARAGKVVGISVICAYGPDGISTQSAGLLPSALIAGCHHMARQLSDALFSAKRSSILTPR